MITTVIFDLDQTLVDRTATFVRFLEKQHGRFQSEMGTISPTRYVSTMLNYDQNGYVPKSDVYGKTCADLGLEISQPLQDDYQDQYGREPILKDGAKPVLEQLSQTHTLGLITNGRTRGQTAKINAAGIGHFFKVIKISEAEGVEKPDPAIFERCLAELGVTPAEAVYIGDHPEKDVLGAQQAGMKGIWVANRYYERPGFADGVIESLSELPLFLHRWRE